MPETGFTIRWPDGETEACYSPSTVIRDHLTQNTTYSLEDFLRRCRAGLTAASDRVEAKYGFRCTSAEAQLEKIERRAATFTPPADVDCLSVS